ncbi:MAG: DUF3793 family protein [Treponema sp.]|nr:DUF3793 family protein [Treponema sp.]
MSLDKIIIKCSAPCICGIKPGNMFTVKRESYSRVAVESWRESLKSNGLVLETFETSDNTMMIFIYNFIWIRQMLEDCFAQSYLRGKNYPVNRGTLAVLNELFGRLKKHQEFPHEVGLFLGYPIEDVIEFEKNQGQDCKYCGCWKSYSNPELAKKSLGNFLDCSKMCQKWFEEGLTVPQIIKKYKIVTEKVA